MVCYGSRMQPAVGIRAHMSEGCLRRWRGLWRRYRRVSVFHAFLAFVMICIPALAKPPPGTDMDSPIARWFANQYNTVGGSCCGLGDGHVIEEEDVRVAGDHFEVQIDGDWYPVRAGQMRDAARGGPNIMRKPIVWYSVTGAGIVIYCLAPGSML